MKGARTDPSRREKLGRNHRLNCEASGPARPLEDSRTEISTRSPQRRRAG